MKILFVILSCNQYESTRQKWQKETWVRDDIDFVYLDNPANGFEEIYTNLSKKYVEFFGNLSSSTIEKYDWFFFCDDDTFVFVDRLIKLLLQCETEMPIMIGHELSAELIKKATDLNIRACSGGAGFVINKPLINHIRNHIRNEEYIVLNEQADVNLAIWASTNKDLRVVDKHYLLNPIKPNNKYDTKNAITFHYCDEQDFKYLNDMIKSEQIDLAKKFISPEAFMLIVLEAMEQNKSLSAVGFGDGERSIMIDSRPAYLSNPSYLKEYGLEGANMPEIRKKLFNAANEANWFCPLISGITMREFDCIRICDPREYYIERLFPYAWYYMTRERDLLKNRSLAVVCRNSNLVALNISNKYDCSVLPIEYSSWKDYDKALEQIINSSEKLILCSVSQSGKYMIVEAAKSGKVVLDIGSALINKWQE